MANTLAYNHLSKHGRSHPSGGPRDTAMYKTSQLGPGRGKVWHVNEDEKRLMNMYGLEGEKLVDAVGSGTINPKTGKEEKFIGTAIALGSLALGAYQSHKAGSIQEQTSKSKLKAAEEGLASLEGAEEKLEESTAAQREVFEQEFGKSQEDLARQTGISLGQARQESTSLAAKSGMARSGTVAKAKETSKENIGAESKSRTEDLISQLGRNMGSVMENYESEKARIKSEKEKFTREKDLAEEQSKSGYLGKNIGRKGRTKNLFRPSKWTLSDARLKRDIKYLYTLSNNIPIYEFKYIWANDIEIGPMAHEVENIIPDAVREVNGYKQVNYEAVFGLNGVKNGI